MGITDLLIIVSVASVCPLSLVIGAAAAFLVLRNAKMITLPWERVTPASPQPGIHPVEFYRPEPFTKILKVEAKNVGRIVQREERAGWTYTHQTDGAGIWWVHFMKERSWRSGHRCNYYPNNH